MLSLCKTTVAIATMLVGIGVVVAAPAGAVRAQASGTGHVTCTTMIGRIKYKPPARNGEPPPPATIRAKVSNCTAANEGPIAGATLVGTIQPPTNEGPICAPFAGGAMQIQIEWKTKAPAPKLFSSSASGGPSTFFGGHPGGVTLVGERKTLSVDAGSFHGSELKMQLVYDAPVGEIQAACASKRGLRTLKFTNVNGASTIDIHTAT